jgi:CHAT domain-containing protein
VTAHFDPPLLPRVTVIRGEVDAGVNLAREWADRQKREGNMRGAAIGYAEAAQLSLAGRRWSTAQRMAEQSEILADSMNFVDESIIAKQARGLAVYHLGDVEEGLQLLREAAAMAVRHPTMGSIVGTHTALGDALGAYGDVNGALEAYDVAAQEIEGSSVSVSGDLHKASFRTQQLTPFTGALRALFASGRAPRDLSTLFSWAARRKAAALAEATGVTSRERRPSLREVQASLGKTEILIDYLAVDSLIAAVVVTPKMATLVDMGFGVADVRSLVQRVRGSLSASYAGAVDLARISFDAPAAQALYRLVLKPALQVTNDARTLLIAPDGPLHHIPFDALVTGDEELSVVRIRDAVELDQVIDQFEVAYVPSGWFVANRPRGSARQLPDNPRIVAVSYAAPGAEDEVNSLRAAWPSARITTLTEASATETAVRRELARNDVAHFAVHAAADDGDVLASYVRVAPDDVNDGYVHVNEVGGLSLTTSLVVLSGCETVSGPLYEGEGLMGLARGYLAAGTPTVVATRWPIGPATASLTGAFYRNLAAGETPGSALRNAKLAVRSDPDTRHPFYWAGWLVIGR